MDTLEALAQLCSRIGLRESHILGNTGRLSSFYNTRTHYYFTTSTSTTGSTSSAETLRLWVSVFQVETASAVQTLNATGSANLNFLKFPNFEVPKEPH